VTGRVLHDSRHIVGEQEALSDQRLRGPGDQTEVLILVVIPLLDRSAGIDGALSI
jgi:hypothetical protein